MIATILEVRRVAAHNYMAVIEGKGVPRQEVRVYTWDAEPPNVGDTVYGEEDDYGNVFWEVS